MHMDQDRYAFSFGHMVDHDEYRVDFTITPERDARGNSRTVLMDITVNAKTINGDWTKQWSMRASCREAFQQLLDFEADAEQACLDLTKQLARYHALQAKAKNSGLNWDNHFDIETISGLEVYFEGGLKGFSL